GLALLAGLLAGVSFLIYFRFHGAGAFERRIESWSGKETSGWRHKVGSLFKGFSVGLQSIRTFGDLVLAIGYSGAHWVLVALIYLWIMHAFGGQFAPIDFGGAIVILAFTMVGSAVQLPVVGGGSLAASFFAMTRIFGVDASPAAIVSIVLYLITFAGCSLAGIPLLLAEGWSMGDLRQMAMAEKKAEAEGTHLHLDNPMVKGDPPK
ncbi:MAG: flippase-like domain-containing protein, partial [Acidobacteria bacterium]|nr:flippase-like domain-containing protein [Acidobacteriota bacterium]